MTDASLMTAVLYKFVELPQYADLQQPLKDVCVKHNLKGTLHLAPEGINGTLAGRGEDVHAVLDFLRSYEAFTDLVHREYPCTDMPFARMKVRIKKEIVTFGDASVDPTAAVGEYISPQDWNSIISEPDVLVIDTRNDYEVGMGSFQGAINPHTQSFTEFRQFVETELDPKNHRKIAMFCTGGIRCEKASSYLLQHDFDTVYHLEGGILNYLANTPQDESLWHGECFVFDERVAVQHGLKPGTYDLCSECGHPVRQPHAPNGASNACPQCHPY